MNTATLLSLIGYGVIAVCLAAYLYGFVWKPIGSRWLHIVSLFCTIMALTLLMLQANAPAAGAVPVIYIQGFLVASGLAQAMSAVRGRRGERRAMRAEDKPEAAGQTRTEPA